MICRIKELAPLPNYELLVSFDDGRTVIYDVKGDIESLPGYDVLRTTFGLFNQVQLDQSRTCVFWSPEIDLPSDAIYEYGRTVAR